MSVINDLRHDANLRGSITRNRFIIMLAGVVMVSMLLVSVAISLYNSSGAAQLDASIPRYAGVRDKVVQDRSSVSFSSSGAFDQKTFDEFFTTYDEYAKAIGQINGYDPSAVNNDSFNLVPAASTPAPAAQ